MASSSENRRGIEEEKMVKVTEDASESEKNILSFAMLQMLRAWVDVIWSADYTDSHWEIAGDSSAGVCFSVSFAERVGIVGKKTTKILANSVKRPYCVMDAVVTSPMGFEDYRLKVLYVT